MKYLLLTLALLLLVTPAQAGKLFPPDGVDENSACPNNQVVGWTGQGLQCQDPTSGVIVPICPAGQVLSGIINGVRNCVSVSANVTVPTCPEGQVLYDIAKGESRCVSVSSKVTIPSCPDGHVLRGISNGSPLCSALPSASGTRVRTGGWGGATTCGHVHAPGGTNSGTHNISFFFGCFDQTNWEKSHTVFATGSITGTSAYHCCANYGTKNAGWITVAVPK